MNVPLIYKSKPAIGIDIGHSSVKIVQLSAAKTGYKVLGYGYGGFSSKAFDEHGVITDHDEVASSIYKLLTDTIVGGVNSDRIITSIPVSRTFSRIVNLPKMSKDQLQSALELEIEQYVPMPLIDLYLDYEITENPQEDGQDGYEVLMVATPRMIIDSYMELFSRLNLEVGSIETSLTASVRSVLENNKIINAERKEESDSDEPEEDGATLIIDFGARSSDLSVFDETIRVTGTVDKGGDTFTEAIAKELSVTNRQAHDTKTRYGIKEGSNQKKMLKALEPSLSQVVKEIKKMQRYYKSRGSNHSDITAVVMLGGGANMPGLPEYIAEQTGIDTSICDPWNKIDFKKLQEPHHLESTLFTTAVGSALKGVKAE